MTWSFIRVAIFSASFIVGLLFSHSGDRPVEFKIKAKQNVSEVEDERCGQKDLTLVRADFRARQISFKSQ
jgi:hypothetical protein